MRKANRKVSDALIEQKLAEARMSERDRIHALQQLREAAAIVEAIMWARERIASLGTLFLKPGLKN